MSFITCWRLRRSLTAYVDGEATAAEREAVERHLAGCEACQHRARVEDAVRHGLRARTARAGSTAWLTPPAFPPRALPAPALAPAALAVGVVAWAYWSGAVLGADPVNAVGVISDSACNGVHHPPDAPDAPPAACVQGCIRKGAHYVFVTGGTIYKVRNQDFAELPASAGLAVQVSGTARGGELTLATVAAAPAAAPDQLTR